MLMFPTAFFLFAGYTESVFLVFTLSAWLLARHQKWGLAGLTGGLASLTRFSGALLTPIFFWMYFVYCMEIQNAKFSRQIQQVLNCLAKPAGLATLFPALFVGIYMFWVQHLGRNTPSDVIATYWGIQMVPPWEGFRLFVVRLFFTPRVFIDWIDLCIFLIALVAITYGLFRQDATLSLYSCLYVSLLMMRGTPPHLLDSFSRYLLLLFPLFLFLGRGGNRVGRTVFWLFSFTLQIILTWGFLQWKWIA
jgi:hypothetical protein